MPEKKKPGFNGQWVDVFSTGNHTDDKGRAHAIDLSFLEQVVNNFNPTLHEPPATIGHPKTDAPAFGWVCGLRVKDDILQARFCDTDPAFEALVKEGKFKKRSSAFYMDTATAPGGQVPALRHVGFLGAQPPAVKGLREIHFDEGEAVTFDITFSEGDSSMDKEEQDKQAQSLADKAWEALKTKLGFGTDKTPASTASFSETDVKALIAEAVSGVETKFSETVKELEAKAKTLEEQVSRQSGSTQRTEIVAFCERLGGGKFLPAFKRMGVPAFMETLAGITDKKVSVITFSEEAGKEVEKAVEITPLQFFQSFLETLPNFIEFGEKFGEFKVKGDGSEIADPEARNKMREGMGLKRSEGGDK